jgi:hypothetical protein
MPFVITCGATVLVLITSARYSCREERKRRGLLSFILALPFGVCALISLSALLEGGWTPVIFWGSLALGAAAISFAADSFLPGCSSHEKGPNKAPEPTTTAVTPRAIE